MLVSPLQFGTLVESSEAVLTATEVVRAAGDGAVVLCDVSPPRGASVDLLAEAAAVDADFLLVAYNPGQSVRVNPLIAALTLQSQFGRQAGFNLATRDMNRIAVQSLLLGASLVGVSNVVVLRGDRLSPQDALSVREVNDYTTTALLRDISGMNDGYDFRGRRLRTPTSLCPGATADISRGIERQVRLTQQKLAAGAEFIVCQPHFNAGEVGEFHTALQVDEDTGQEPRVFAGLQVLHGDGIDFGNVPEQTRREVAAGRAGLDIAAEQASLLWEFGLRLFYLIPPILPGGVRDYEAGQDLIDFIRGLR